jgi:hypothetical protein
MIRITQPLFNPGRVGMTVPARDALLEHEVEPISLIRRHVCGDFGDLEECDRKANVRALKDESRILSAYQFGESRFYVITEADRSSTTIMKAEEY